MTELDQALAALREHPEDTKAQSGFYDLFLNSSFFVPTVTENLAAEGEEAEESEVPLVVENDGIDFLVFFDQQQRLSAWAEQDVPSVKLPGYLIAEMTTAGMHWALNIGTDHFKTFVPDEIAWLQDVVKRCKAEEEAASGGV